MVDALASAPAAVVDVAEYLVGASKMLGDKADTFGIVESPAIFFSVLENQNDNVTSPCNQRNFRIAAKPGCAAYQPRNTAVTSRFAGIEQCRHDVF